MVGSRCCLLIIPNFERETDCYNSDPGKNEHLVTAHHFNLLVDPVHLLEECESVDKESARESGNRFVPPSQFGWERERTTTWWEGREREIPEKCEIPGEVPEWVSHFCEATLHWRAQVSESVSFNFHLHKHIFHSHRKLRSHPHLPHPFIILI